MKKAITRRITALLMMALILVVGNAAMFPISVDAASNTIALDGTKYAIKKNSNYVLSDATTYTAVTKNNAYGELTITGDMSSIADVDGYHSYMVNDGVVTISYAIDETKLLAGDEEWHLCSDSTKKVDNTELDRKVAKGAVILQASIDGSNWITETYQTDIFSDSTLSVDFYSTADIQQLNGCYYRVIVAYELEKKTGDSWFFGKDEHEYGRYAEEYTFYLIDSESNAANTANPAQNPKKNLGTVKKTGKDCGFSGEREIDLKDPHYGWDIGTFFVNGYTRNLEVDKTPVFLKNVGDTVTLWFNLKQDINCLNGSNRYVISEDKNGYDQYFGVEKTNFGHGTLIIRYTDFENVKSDPIIYTDFLAANARTGANTRVQLFEEGNYEVALDYEIADTKGVDTYTNYRIYFTFQIRNGNCMVYPFDINTGAELSDSAITENGFRLDMARSRYLNIDVKKSTIAVGNDGLVSEDVRFNRPAKDGESYSDEGIYTFSVKNIYTGDTTTKILYVGTNKYLRALSKNKLTIKELNDYIRDGYTIESSGRLTAPPEPEIIEEEEIITEEPVIEEPVIEEQIPEESVVEEVPEEESVIEEVESVDSEEPEVEIIDEEVVEIDNVSGDAVNSESISVNDVGDSLNNSIVKILIVIVGVLLVGIVLLLVRMKKSAIKSEAKPSVEDVETDYREVIETSDIKKEEADEDEKNN